jgi:SAM-dependent methyltransferase
MAADGMVVQGEARQGWAWRCLQCRGALASDGSGLHCPDCGKQYPVISGIPILMREPSEYLRSELAALRRASREARHRREGLELLKSDAGLPDVSTDRHRDIVDAEIARAEAFLALLEPAVSAQADASRQSPGARSPGWTLEALVPFLLRDWTNTSELDGIRDRVAAALGRAFTDLSGKSAVFPACGAGGLLAKLAPEFGEVVGFDLTLPALKAGRDLLDGKSFDLALPRVINEAGRVMLRGENSEAVGPHAVLAAMDAFNTAFADGSVDCVITAFLIDLIAEPLRLADEIHRILRDDGVWINWGPSGSLKALWRFDQTETAAYFEAAGFSVIGVEAFRTTHLDVSRECPFWGFHNLICYLASARKTVRKTGRAGKGPSLTTAGPARLPQAVPRHFPGAQIIQRQKLGIDEMPRTVLRHERFPSRMQSIEINDETARLIALVDGKRTVSEIAEMFKGEIPGLSAADIVQAFTQYFEQGLLDWRGQGDQ